MWLSLAAAIWIFMEPSRINAESLASARRRVAKTVVRDPFFWFCLALFAYGMVVLFNTGVAPAYDPESMKWHMMPAPMPLLPASAAGYGADALAEILALTVVLQGCRNALGKNARLAFLVSVSFVSGVVALIWAGFLPLGGETFLSMAECSVSDPRYRGCVFGIFSVASASALPAVFVCRWHKCLIFVFAGIVGNVIGLLLFAPPACTALFAAVHLLLFLYSFFYIFRETGSMVEFRYAVVFLIALTLAAIAAFFVLPEDLFSSKTAPWTTGDFLPMAMLDTRKVLSGIAFSVWHDAPWLGSGMGTFVHDIGFFADDGLFALLPHGQAMPLNGYWHVLAEGGIVGVVFLALTYGFLFFTFVRNLLRGVGKGMPSPLCWAGLLAVIAVALEGAVDCSFSTPGALVALCALMALSAASFPKGVK